MKEKHTTIKRRMEKEFRDLLPDRDYLYLEQINNSDVSIEMTD